MTYQIRVAETRIYRTIYTVEADTPEEAAEKAEEGDTIHEVDYELQEVTCRTRLTAPKLVQP